MDTGAGASVTKKRTSNGYPIRPSKGSIAGQNFGGPGGEKYPNEGEVTYKMIHKESGVKCTGTYQVAEGVNKTLMAVSESADKGNLSIFDKECGYGIRRDSPEGQQIIKLVEQARQKIRY